MTPRQIPAHFTKAEWARIAWACAYAGQRELVAKVFVRTGIDPVAPPQDE